MKGGMLLLACLSVHLSGLGGSFHGSAPLSPEHGSGGEIWRQSRAKLEDALSARPSDPVILTKCGTMMRLRGDISASGDVLRRALAFSPGHIPAQCELAALEHEGLGNTGAACHIYRSVVDQNPSSALAHQGYGKLLHSVGERDAAVTELEAAVALDPGLAHALLLLSTLKKDRGEVGAAQSALEMAASLLPSDGGTMIEQAESTIATADAAMGEGSVGRAKSMFREAQNLLERALMIAPSSQRALLLLASLHGEQTGNLAAQRRCLERAWSLDPSQTVVGVCLGKCLLSQGSHADAASVFRQVMRQEPLNVQAKCNAASALMAAKDPESLAIFEEAIELDPDNAGALGGYGLALKTIDGDMEGAEAAYKLALRIKPDDAATLVNMGLLTEAKKEPGCMEEAMGFYKRAQWSDPQNVRAHWYRGVFYEDVAMDTEAAEDFYLQAAKWGQNSNKIDERDICSQALSRVALFKWKIHNETRRARAIFESALTVYPNHPSSTRQYAAFLSEQGIYNNSMCMYHAALQLNPHDDNARGELADLSLNMGHVMYAAELYRDVLSRTPTDPAALKGLANLLNQTSQADGAGSTEALELVDMALREEEKREVEEKEEEKTWEETLKELHQTTKMRVVQQTPDGTVIEDELVEFNVTEPDGPIHESEDELTDEGHDS